MLITISDKKIGVDANGDGAIDYYNADIVTANDYYAFGSQMPGRIFVQGNNKYRYGFNGKENDNEVKGTGNQQDYGKRIYDPRLGKFLSVDPMANSYPFYSPYQFAGNDVIRCIDLEGGEPLSRTGDWDHKTSFLSGITTYEIYDKTKNQIFQASGVIDPWSGKTWIVAEDGQGQNKYFYLVNDNKSTDKLKSYVENGRRVLYGGHFERFETRNETDRIQGAAIANAIGVAVFGAAVAIAAAPVAMAGGTATATYVAASGESAGAIVSAGLGDATAAYGTAGAGIVAGGAAAYGASGNATPVEGMLLNNANVIRAGIATEEAIINSSAKLHPSGIPGFSVESANGLTAEELSRSPMVKNGKMGVTTVGEIRSAGGQVTPTSGGSPNHATASGLSPKAAVKLLNPPVINPNPAPKR